MSIPAHPDALGRAGPSFLTEAFRASGALSADNRVAEITRFEHQPGGSTGRKLLLSVTPAKPAASLHTDLFVKFSRDFTDPLRDQARFQMAAEVRFAHLSRTAGFPITVPDCVFADYHAASGTGILITERVAFASAGVERHYGKCLDHAMPQPLEHYEALTRTLARLAGTHRAGTLPESLTRHFPFDPTPPLVGERPSYTAAQLRKRVARLADFAARFPQLLPGNVSAPAFIARLGEEITGIPPREPDIWQFLFSQRDLIALCHWNANVDNAWFWRNREGELECGLLDWGNVGQMNLAMALWGAFSGADITLWDRHLEGLLRLFAAEYRLYGGPALDVEELTRHLYLYVAVMGATWLMDAPALIQKQIPDLADIKDRFDPRFEANETARTQLHMLTTFLHLWDTRNFGRFRQRFA